jgi:NADH-quinone oxidoreductase subunit E
MLRRLHLDQPDSFAFTPANQDWAEAQLTKYPEGRQASAIIPLLWRAQEQEGWLTRPAIEHVAQMLGLAYIRALEVATFYFMFQLAPVGRIAHVQICGTTSCMICGAEDLVAVCRDRIAPQPHQISADGNFSWEEVECLGACANAPMALIGKDYYEDLTAAKLAEILEVMAAGKVPVPGPQNGRYASEPVTGLTSLKDFESGRTQYNASAAAAVALGDTLKRIDGTEVPLLTPWRDASAHKAPKPAAEAAGTPGPKPATGARPDATGVTVQEAQVVAKARPRADAPAAAAEAEGPAAPHRAAGAGLPPAPEVEVAPAVAPVRPAALAAPREGRGDDLKMIKGVGPKLEKLLQSLGFWHFDQIAGWTEAEIAWVDENLEGFRGRVRRDDWVAQARVLAAGGKTAFSERVAKGDIY